MRVLVVHNRYSSRVPSGENLAVADEVRWLRDAGVDVTTHEVSNDDVFDATGPEKVRQAAESMWSPSAARHVGSAIDEVQPDIVHVHNLFPLLTTSVPWAATRRRVPVVWTAHNRRVVCVAGNNFRDGGACTDCRPGWRLPGIRHACYGESVAASLLITGATAAFRWAARRRSVVVAPSESARRWLIDAAGFQADQVFRKYNGVQHPPPGDVVLPAAASRTFLFSGHLSEHKGMGLLLEAWRRADLPGDVDLLVLGDGPRAADVQAAASADPRIRWLGSVEPKQVSSHLAAARAAIVPSTVEESFGRSAAEALAHGRPVVTTGAGGLGEIVDDRSGWITGTDRDGLAQALVEAARSDEAVTARAGTARDRYLQMFSPEATTLALLDIYATCLGADRTRAPRA
jgi:glycosyltransferase involved in cell wall biosynthesis